MRVISLNANGIRSAARKGLFDWLPQQKADFLCLQELKAQLTDIEADETFAPKGWHAHFSCAQKKGYSGVGIFARQKPDAVLDKLGAAEFDDEGRYIELRYGKLSVVSLYVPSGSAGPERQASKDRFLEFFLPVMRDWLASDRQYIVVGDWNIAHRNIDLKNWRSNQKNSGFLPHERAWMDQLLGVEPAAPGWVDAYRHLHPDTEGEAYTWWSNRGQAWANNVGWRIDYQIITPNLGKAVQRAAVWKDTRFSDHAPLTMDYQL
ncbi:exodeoxyribonuclease III [Solimonas marina]|uniref:Exodeoxyribonuclease III n=1 Tax=Solimonas marina TaxID=2714601 RepID=A0A969WC98_9GAMM|nr:exodeoxyribonuclease III [Solimonas marina]NKF24557.1 exodeoxyribonuclease III [Solimonas marina]